MTLEKANFPRSVLEQAEKIEISLEANSLFENLHHVFGQTIQPEGEWELIVQRKDPKGGDILFSAAIFVDDKIVKYDLTLPSSLNITEGIIPMKIKIFEDSTPVKHMIEGQVTVTHPKNAAGSVYSRYLPEIGNDPKSVSWGDITGIKRAIGFVLHNKKAAKDLREQKISILKLIPTGDGLSNKGNTEKGVYSCVYKDVKVPGSYHLEFKFKCAGTKTGTFERTVSRTVLVKSQPDAKKTTVEAQYDKDTHFLHLRIIPRDPFGNLLGPGQAQEISCEADWKSDINVLDNLDGSYTIVISAKKEVLQKQKLLLKMINQVLIDEFPAVILMSKGKGKV